MLKIVFSWIVWKSLLYFLVKFVLIYMEKFEDIKFLNFFDLLGIVGMKEFLDCIKVILDSWRLF